MEFQAYASSPVGQKAGKMRSLWHINDIIHGGCSSLVPIAILAAACSLVVYQHVTAENEFQLSTRFFLSMMVVSMAPLALLEKKLLSCSDPLGLLYKFSGKVVLMQTIQLVLRVGAGAFLQDFEHGYFSTNFILLVSALVLLPIVFGMRPTRQWIVENSDVLLLAALALSLAVATSLVDDYKSQYVSTWTRRRMNAFMVNSVSTSSDYLELVSFLPAVWMVSRNKELKEVDVQDARRRAAALIVFLLSFYFLEDIATGVWILMGQGMPLVVLAHTAHFLLVVDFALYFSAHLYDPEKFDKIIGNISDWFADTCCV